MPRRSNPLSDRTGKYCGRNQIDPDVWFLAGTFGGNVKRTCTIPKSRAILFPIVNCLEFMKGKRRRFKSDGELVTYVKKICDDIKEIAVTVDGLQSSDLRKNRIFTPAFDLILSESNTDCMKPGANRGAGDGYWVLLKPLSSGKHRISFSGIDPAYGPDFKTSATYDLTVQ
jgi:hypothetical protein